MIETKSEFEIPNGSGVYITLPSISMSLSAAVQKSGRSGVDGWGSTRVRRVCGFAFLCFGFPGKQRISLALGWLLVPGTLGASIQAGKSIFF